MRRTEGAQHMSSLIVVQQTQGRPRSLGTGAAIGSEGSGCTTAENLTMVSGLKENPNETDRIPVGWSCNAGRGCRLHSARSQSRGLPDLRYQYSRWIPRLEANLRGPRGRQLPQLL